MSIAVVQSAIGAAVPELEKTSATFLQITQQLEQIHLSLKNAFDGSNHDSPDTSLRTLANIAENSEIFAQELNAIAQSIQGYGGHI